MTPEQNVEKLHTMHTSSERPHRLLNADEIWPLHTHAELPAFEHEMLVRLSERYDWELPSYLRRRVLRMEDALEVTDLSHKTIWVNQAFLKLMGYPSERVLNKISSVFETVKENIFSTKTKEGVQVVDYVFHKAYGEPLLLRAEINPIWSIQGQLSHLLIFQNTINLD